MVGQFHIYSLYLDNMPSDLFKPLHQMLELPIAALLRLQVLSHNFDIQEPLFPLVIDMVDCLYSFRI